MKLRVFHSKTAALTMVEVLVVVLVLFVLAAILLPALAAAKKKSSKIGCVNELKQIGLAFRIWSGDNWDKYPMEVSVATGGAMELAVLGDAAAVFQVMSNELSTPKLILCPEDSLRRHAATNFTDDLKNKISYFINTTATDADPQMLLSGDDNFLLNQSPVKPGQVNMASTDTLEWDETRHGEVTKQGWFMKDKKAVSGNIGLTDGSVQSVTSSGLTNALHQAVLATNRLVIP